MNSQTSKLIADLTRGGETARRAARLIRARSSFDEVTTILNCNELEPRVSEALLTGTITAQKLRDTWKPFEGAPITNSARSIAWFSALLTKHQPILARHIAAREHIEFLALNGEREEAFKRLVAHRQTFGYTLWHLGWELSLTEEFLGAKYRRTLMDHISQDAEGAPIRTLAAYLSLCSDKTLSADHVREALLNYLPEDHPVLRNFLQLLLLQDLPKQWHVWEVLYAAECIPIIDRYEALLRLLVISIASSHDSASHLARLATALNEQLRDRCLSYTLDCLSQSACLSANDADIDLNNAWDAYVTSRYDGTRTAAQQVIHRSPCLLPALELSVRSALYLKEEPDKNPKTPLAFLRMQLRNVLSKNAYAESSLEQLEHFGTRFRVVSLTFPLRAFCAQHSSTSANIGAQTRAAYSYGCHSPRNFAYSDSAPLNASYIARYRATFQNSIAAHFFSANTTDDPVNSDYIGSDKIPPLRKYFFAGLAAAQAQRRLQALHFLERFLAEQLTDSQNPLSPFAIEEARRTMVDLYVIGGDGENALRVAVQVFIDRNAAARRLPLNDIFNLCQANRNQCCRLIEYPIVAFLAADRPQRMSIELRRFLRANGVQAPHELLAIATRFDKHTLGILLLRVCTKDVLDSFALLFTSLEAVEAERLLLLEWIRRNIASLANTAEHEVLRITQQAKLRRTLQHIDASRVSLNLSGLRDAEQHVFEDIFFRYNAQRQLYLQTKADATSIAGQFGLGADVPKSIHGSQIRADISSFSNAFRQIRDRFLFSPHFGLEACLSGRIRHGFLVRHIRRAFVDRHLMVTTAGVDFQRALEYWSKHVPKEELESVMNALLELTTSVNECAIRFKDVQVKSKTEATNPDGLLDYVFPDHLLHRIAIESMGDVTAAGQLLELAFGLLVQRTENVLTCVRTFIENDLRKNLRKAIDDALSRLVALSGAVHVRHQLTVCRHHSDEACENLASWFRLKDVIISEDVNADLVANISKEMTEALNTEHRNTITINCTQDIRVAGKNVTPFAHILFYLLDNAVQYSDLPAVDFEASIEIKAAGSDAQISVANALASEGRARQARDRIEREVISQQGHLDPAKIITEGGTGLAKVLSHLKHSFKLSQPQISASCSSNVVEVKLVIPLQALA